MTIATTHRGKNPGPYDGQREADAKISQLVGDGSASQVSEYANLPAKKVKTGSAPASVPEGQTPAAASENKA